MGIATQSEFHGFPISSSSSEEKSDFALYLELNAKDGGLIPQAMLPAALGLSKQRISQFVAEKRFVVHRIGGTNYVTGRSFEAFLVEERRSGRPVREPSMSDLATAAKEFISEEKDKRKKR